MNRIPKIAVVGRQNVGKSTLVNRLFGRREAIAHRDPGVTRDRLELEASWRGRRFGLIDTAGFLAGARGVEAIAVRQSERATDQADAVLLVVDARAGVTEEDATLARRLRRATAPVIVVANKVDDQRDEADAAAFHALGLGEPVAVSALHGRGTGDLLDRLVALLPTAVAEEALEEAPSVAIVGRPNVGKSSLFNRLVGEERSVVYEDAGTTRDAVDAVVDWGELGRVRFVDTAGMRRGPKVQGVEYYGLLRARGAIVRAGVVALVLDAREGFTSDDRRIAAAVIQAGRALLVVANKWDLVERKDRTFDALREVSGPFARAPIARTSALRGQGVRRLPRLIADLHARWTSRAPTARVNEILEAAQRERAAPRGTGRLRYATQVSSAPPTFVLFGAPSPEPSYRRFLENRLRAALGLDGVPLRLAFRPKRGGR